MAPSPVGWSPALRRCAAAAKAGVAGKGAQGGDAGACPRLSLKGEADVGEPDELAALPRGGDEEARARVAEVLELLLHIGCTRVQEGAKPTEAHRGEGVGREKAAGSGRAHKRNSWTSHEILCSVGVRSSCGGAGMQRVAKSWEPIGTSRSSGLVICAIALSFGFSAHEPVVKSMTTSRPLRSYLQNGASSERTFLSCREGGVRRRSQQGGATSASVRRGMLTCAVRTASSVQPARWLGEAPLRKQRIFGPCRLGGGERRGA